LGPFAALVVSAAILFIVVIALAGLAFVVVKALGGEEVRLPKGTRIVVPDGMEVNARSGPGENVGAPPLEVPGGCTIRYRADEKGSVRWERFVLNFPEGDVPHVKEDQPRRLDGIAPHVLAPGPATLTLPDGCVVPIPGSSWGTFTIAATIPIALLVGLYMY